MASLGAAIFPLKQLSVVYSKAAAPTVGNFASLFKVIGYQRRTSFCFPVIFDHTRGRISAVGSDQVSFLPNNKQGLWEGPDDGNGSDYDHEDDELQGNDLDFESDWEAGPNALATASNFEKLSTSNYEEDLVQVLRKMARFPHFDKLLEDVLDLDSLDKDGMTTLHKAIIGKKEPAISDLLKKGANPNVKDLDGATPLHYAVHVGVMQTVKLLIRYKVDMNVVDNGWIPLHIAMQSKNRDIAKVLLVNGADQTRRNEDGKTPLDLNFCHGKDFKSHDLAKLLKQVPASRGL